MSTFHTSVSARQLFLPAIVVFGLLLGAIVDFWVGSPGDAMLLLAAFVASGAGVLIRWSDGALGDQLRSLVPPAFGRQVAATGLFTFSAAAVFIKITEDVVENESYHLDRATSFLVHGLDTAMLDTIMRGASELGTIGVFAYVAVAVLTWCWRSRDAAAFAGLLGVIAADQSFKHVLKNIFDRPRPALFHDIPALDSYSYPSGHAMAAVAMYGMVAVVIGRLEPRLKPWLGWGAAGLAVLIGYSRVYLGAHWFTDVLAGYAAGATILGAGIMWLEAFPPRRTETSPIASSSVSNRS